MDNLKRDELYWPIKKTLENKLKNFVLNNWKELQLNKRQYF